MSDLFTLDGRVVLVTGASRGLGWAMAEALARAGALVVLNGRDAATLTARAEALRGNGWGADTAAFDVTDEAAVVDALPRIAERHGRLDGLIANAGIQHRRPLADFATADFDRVVATNLRAPFVLAREAAGLMAAGGGGRIVTTASIMGPFGRATISAYVASKGGVAALTRALAVELAPKGILVNAIAPGFFATEMNTALTEDAAFTRFIEQRTPMARWGRPEEIAGAAVFLMSDAASYVTGHVLTVDGGLSVQV
ncbi:MAG: SDR family oxidoreductase [Alphaproteobacteria bacterium]|jgi:gluconate 5-dehydrogenase|nr:SDR family oxidoreductase [Alphaproteobacteria bacterium]